MIERAQFERDMSSVGRMGLIEMLACEMVTTSRLQRDHDAMLANLTATQERCTALLEETRELKAINTGLSMRACSAERERDLLRAQLKARGPVPE